MATVFESIDLTGIRRADLRQLLEILRDHEESGIHWGNQREFQERTTRLTAWLEDAVKYAYSEGVKMPRPKPGSNACRVATADGNQSNQTEKP